MSDNTEYVALQPIDHNGVRAYNPGDRVPASNVKRHGYQNGVQVAEEGSPEARALRSPASVSETQDAPTSPPPSTPSTPSTARSARSGGKSS